MNDEEMNHAMKPARVISGVCAALFSAVAVSAAFAAQSIGSDCGRLGAYTQTMKSEAFGALSRLCHDTDRTWFDDPGDRDALKGAVIMAGASLAQGNYGDAGRQLHEYATALRALMGEAGKRVDTDRAQGLLLLDDLVARAAVTNLN